MGCRLSVQGVRRMRIEIIYEDEAVLVVYKPAGLAVQSARVTQPDVVSELGGYLQGGYVGLVHRLDQPVEGLLAVAKNKRAAAALSRQLQDGRLEKRYYAVVSAEDAAAHAAAGQQAPVTLTDYIRKDKRTNRAQIVTAPDKDTQRAVLTYRMVETGRHTALFDIALMTGRFHQIRAQMAHAGMPLLGDRKYGSDCSQGLSDELHIRYVALCAYSLCFLHPDTGEALVFERRPQGEAFQVFDAVLKCAAKN